MGQSQSLGGWKGREHPTWGRRLSKKLVFSHRQVGLFCITVIKSITFSPKMRRDRDNLIKVDDPPDGVIRMCWFPMALQMSLSCGSP